MCSLHYCLLQPALNAFVITQEGSRVDKQQGARLTRYVAALPLDITHKRALVQSAAARNMEVQNYRWVGK